MHGIIIDAVVTAVFAAVFAAAIAAFLLQFLLQFLPLLFSATALLGLTRVGGTDIQEEDG